MDIDAKSINDTMVSRWNCWVHSTSHQSKSQIWFRSWFLPTPLAFEAPARGGGFPSGYCHKVWYGKLECCGYSMVKKFWKCVYSRAVKHCNRSKCRHKTWQVCSWDQMEVEFKGGCDTVTRWVADGVIPSPMNSSSCCCCCCCCCNQKASISLML